jgi:hypothetical protein
MPVVANDFDYGPTATQLISESASNDLASFDPLPIISSTVANTANTLAPSAGVAPVQQSSSSSGGSFFGTRGIAIVLGLLFIGGSILLFLGDDIAGAVKIASKVAT